MFDLARELPFIAGNEPLALYWAARAFLLEERDVFDEISASASAASPLAASFVERLDARWKAKPERNERSMVATRALLRREKNAPRKAKWDKKHPRDALV